MRYPRGMLVIVLENSGIEAGLEGRVMGKKEDEETKLWSPDMGFIGRIPREVLVGG